MDLVDISRSLSKKVSRLSFGPPTTHVYNPLEYAREPHELYLSRWGRGPKEVLFLGMNPGPFGMAQTGVPFGEVSLVRDFVGVEGKVGSPRSVHPKRPIEGFACRRSEVSGRRLWGWAQKRFETPEAFFRRFFVYNYCPLCFMEESGKNRTPDKLPPAERDALLFACDEALRQVVKTLEPRFVIGVGAFAQKRAEKALEGLDVAVGGILHPSPASPRANRDWEGQAEADLRALGISLP